ncbi:MAG: methyltransferase family protein [Candidatus Thorarchaeota archaeon]
MLELLFYVVLISDILLLFGVVFSVAFPRYRIWPPPSRTSWQYWVSWFFIILSSVGVPVIGFLDLGSMWPIQWVSFVFGGVLVLIATFLIYWGIRTLSLHQSLGLEGELITNGPYKYTRNPQYLAMMLFYLSLIIVTGSYLTFLTGSLLILMYIITPFCEEPWLVEQFGKEYIQYSLEVPRFVGFRSIESKKSGTERN